MQQNYRYTGRQGIDDLKSMSPYSEDQWEPKYQGLFGVSEEDYLRNPEAYQKQVEEFNAKYIADLFLKGEYGKEWHRDFVFQTLDEFSSPPGDDSKSDILIPKGNTGEIPKFNVKYFKK